MARSRDEGAALVCIMGLLKKRKMVFDVLIDGIGLSLLAARHECISITHRRMYPAEGERGIVFLGEIDGEKNSKLVEGV